MLGRLGRDCLPPTDISLVALACAPAGMHHGLASATSRTDVASSSQPRNPAGYVVAVCVELGTERLPQVGFFHSFVAKQSDYCLRNSLQILLTSRSSTVAISSDVVGRALSCSIVCGRVASVYSKEKLVLLRRSLLTDTPEK